MKATKTARVGELKSATATAVALAPERTSPAILQAVERVASGAYEIDPLRDSRWSGLVDHHPQASVFHSPRWLTALQAVYGYEPAAVTTCPPGSPLTNGLVFCRVKSWLTGRRLVSLPFSDHCDPLVDRADELDVLLVHLKQEITQEKWKYFEIRPISFEPSVRTELGQFVTYYFHKLDLGPGTDQLFHNFHKDCVQRKIRRAVRERLKYEEGASEDLLQKFYHLLVMTRRRQYSLRNRWHGFAGWLHRLERTLRFAWHPKMAYRSLAYSPFHIRKPWFTNTGAAMWRSTTSVGLRYCFGKPYKTPRSEGLRSWRWAVPTLTIMGSWLSRSAGVHLENRLVTGPTQGKSPQR